MLLHKKLPTLDGLGSFSGLKMLSKMNKDSLSSFETMPGLVLCPVMSFKQH